MERLEVKPTRDRIEIHLVALDTFGNFLRHGVVEKLSTTIIPKGTGSTSYLVPIRKFLLEF